MFHLLTFAGIISAIALLARANKSNKLFWVLLVSACLGYAGGSMSSSYKNYLKKECIVQKFLLQGTDATIPDVDSENVIGITEGKLITFVNRVFDTKLAVKNRMYSDTLHSGTLLAFNPDFDIGENPTPNTS